ncbi:MAG TPA: Mut7-C RNAse domain-containing protein [Gemmataceae bacterium]|nr:Mut7-C RNAse domain-containing protein [Gemmataceae bacterium]
MTEPTFACDAMLVALARWLRACGYDASAHPHIDDWDLIRLARREGRILLSSDTGIFKVGIVRDGEVPALHVPNGLRVSEQLAFVLRRFGLRPRQPRCMTCGGPLAEAPPEQVRDRVPPRSFAWAGRFWECQRCGQVFWPGTHWRRIADRLAEAHLGRTNAQ